MPGFSTNHSSYAHPRHIGVTADRKAHPCQRLFRLVFAYVKSQQILAWWWVLTEHWEILLTNMRRPDTL